MKSFLSLILFLISLTHVTGQTFSKLLYSKKDKPTVLINGKVIANWDFIQKLPDGSTENMTVLKSVPNGKDQYVGTYPNLSEYGLLLASVKNAGDINTTTQDQIRAFFQMPATTKIYADGYLVVSDAYSFATKSIREIELLKPDEVNFNAETIINIWTLNKNERFKQLSIPTETQLLP